VFSTAESAPGARLMGNRVGPAILGCGSTA